MRRGTCIHYTGLFSHERKCKAGVEYDVAFGKQPGVFLRMPCVDAIERPLHRRGTYVKAGEPSYLEQVDRKGEQRIPCDLRLEPTDEQVEQDRRASDDHYQKTVTAIKVASNWRVKPKPTQDRREVVECPVCNGKLHLFQSSYNGHVHGKCETAECVSWME
jgi:hypothetical protein